MALSIWRVRNLLAAAVAFGSADGQVGRFLALSACRRSPCRPRGATENRRVARSREKTSRPRARGRDVLRHVASGQGRRIAPAASSVEPSPPCVSCDATSARRFASAALLVTAVLTRASAWSDALPSRTRSASTAIATVRRSAGASRVTRTSALSLTPASSASAVTASSPALPVFHTGALHRLRRAHQTRHTRLDRGRDALRRHVLGLALGDLALQPAPPEHSPWRPRSAPRRCGPAASAPAPVPASVPRRSHSAREAPRARAAWSGRARPSS